MAALQDHLALQGPLFSLNISRKRKKNAVTTLRRGIYGDKTKPRGEEGKKREN